MRIYVRNFENGIDEKRLERLFAKYGYVEDVIVWWNSESQGLKAYVEMPENDAEYAINKLNGRYWHGRRLKVTRAKPKPEPSENPDRKKYMDREDDYYNRDFS